MKVRILFIPFAALLLLTTVGSAQRSGFGLGLMVGEPTGLSAKTWLNGASAVDMGMAWSFRGVSALQLQADYVVHNYSLIYVRSGQLPVYYGIGGWLLLGDVGGLGVRVPVGLDYQFPEAPLDVFLEIAPMLSLSPATSFEIGGALGIRFWFR